MSIQNMLEKGEKVEILKKETHCSFFLQQNYAFESKLICIKIKWLSAKSSKCTSVQERRFYGGHGQTHILLPECRQEEPTVCGSHSVAFTLQHRQGLLFMSLCFCLHASTPSDPIRDRGKSQGRGRVVGRGVVGASQPALLAK